MQKAAFDRDQKIAQDKENYTLSSELPKLSQNSELLVGMANPQFRSTIFPRALLANILFSGSVYQAVANYGCFASSLDYWTFAMNNPSLITIQSFFNTPIIPRKYYLLHTRLSHSSEV